MLFRSHAAFSRRRQALTVGALRIFHDPCWARYAQTFALALQAQEVSHRQCASNSRWFGRGACQIVSCRALPQRGHNVRSAANCQWGVTGPGGGGDVFAAAADGNVSRGLTTCRNPTKVTWVYTAVVPTR